MKVAICFWGLCRSTEFTIERLHQYLFTVLKDAGVQYKVFVHALTLSRPYTNTRANEYQIRLNQDSWKLLSPDVYSIEEQDEVDKKLNLQQYRIQRDPWQKDNVMGYQAYSCVDNCVRALYSLNQVTHLWESDAEGFDAVLYIRPDVKLVTPFNITWLEELHPTTIYIPNFHLINGWNDRFALGIPEVMRTYGHRYVYSAQYAKHFPFHSERFLAHSMNNHKISVNYISFAFWRVRAGGKIHENDMKITIAGCVFT